MPYQFDHSWEHERERLAAIERGGDPETIAILEAIGVAPGWRCLEVGAGGGTIVRWLCERVGTSGHVVATDLETGFLAEIDADANLEIRKHDVVADPLETDAFDLVYSRKVLEHLPEHEAALAKMVDAVRPGGWLLAEDGDLVSMFGAVTADLLFFERAYKAFIESMSAAGYQPRLGLHLGARLLEAGLHDVRIRGRAGEWTGAGDAPSVFLRTFEKIRDRVVAEGRLSDHDADRLLEEIRSPDFRAITAIHVAAWGRKP